MAMQTLSFQASDEIVQKLEFLAKATERSKAYIIRKALLEYMEDMEDLRLVNEFEKTFDPSKMIDFEDFRIKHGLI